MKFKRINASSNARLIKLLVDSDTTCCEAADHIGLHYLTVARFMRELHRQKVIHICEWRRDARGCASERVWAFGEARDARKPPALTNTQRKQAARARKVHRAMIQATAGSLTV